MYSSLVELFLKNWYDYCNKYNIKYRTKVYRKWYHFNKTIIIEMIGDKMSLDNAEEQLKLLTRWVL